MIDDGGPARRGPGRHEPGHPDPDHGRASGIDFAGLLDTIGYSGLIAAEYLPISATVDGFGWIDALRRQT